MKWIKISPHGLANRADDDLKRPFTENRGTRDENEKFDNPAFPIYAIRITGAAG